ncbi:hypothetical protein [Corallococcus macrosporus]|uniref:Uncharacterized protein n=2 Tax=Myxococcaceae TaxID=31 RepID=A0A250K560_9BACT|nr:hypothetical protein [Corallococcus macrosporus]AEI64412.1 hypothetical protein LILAB_12525 [Corallococcus macrosporus]ATB50822.1 hypothetical protein MYMAC_006479 [Corallococcus macrosporus DSM 14697]
MRSAGPTSPLSRPGRRAHGLLLAIALGTVLASIPWINVLGLTVAAELPVTLRASEGTGAWVDRGGVAFVGKRTGQWRRGRLAGVGVDTWAAVMSAPAAAKTKPSLGRGRESFQPGFQEAHRQARERRRAVATDAVRLLRSAALAVPGGDAGDRPTLVTQSLRGPPARG